MAEDNNMVVDEQTRKKANIYFFSKVAVNLLLMIIGAVIIGIFLTQMQRQTALLKQKENSQQALTEAVSALEENAENAETLSMVFHDSNQDVLDDMSHLLSSGLFTYLADVDNKERSAVFADIIKRSGVQYLFMMSQEGKIVISSEPALYGENPAARALMTQENVNDILKGTKNEDGTVRPVEVGNQYGVYYFYSMPFKYKGQTFCLVAGSESSVLDVQISSLRDVSVVLSRAAVSNGGFMFAVDKRDGTFTYYKHGDDVFTGRSATYMGLSREALDDGYAGVETINGVKYYCVSKGFGDKAVVCAVAQTSDIYASDKYVLFWSITGFILTMIICLGYAVVVRNDFVRNAVQTERKVLNPGSANPIYFDKSIFKRVVPLMLVGVLVMYGISFYTQTLLEISEGIEKSNVALDEVAGRYEESLEKRDIIQNYYDNRFLSKTRLFAFLLEEDPRVLNADSEYYYSDYDNKGNRHYILDDEGNPLKSINESARLQELCDANDVDSIYIFDENGHTIGTNTKNWYFTISRNEEDQSYPFMRILDGRDDSLVQEPMTDDLGNSNQYVGVRFNYYTKKDAHGDTVYVPRVEYERAVEADGVKFGSIAGGITAHQSLIQVGLDAEMSQKLLDSTSVEKILSTNMLSGGFIVMFDKSEDHLCEYSPNETTIGKSAKELGISDAAFDGSDYYGFSKVNGVDYFQCFKYSDGYFIATALPRSQMYQSRGIIALITAIISFILILVLSGTVVLTNKEEEYLYETMSEDQASKGLNSAIFSIILPSGRRASTTKAAARWDNRRIPWRDKSVEQKLMTMIGIVAGILVIYVICTVAFSKSLFEESSIINYIINGNWDRGTNIFAFSECAMVLITVALGVVLLRIPVRIITDLLGARGETIGHLFLSVVKYGGALFSLFYCLFLLGIDSSRLLASAGILSLIVGLGAQSLIKDIIAGIFIVFEGEFRVGDIVTINGYRGTVMDIGLRTTKIMGTDGNIKIYNNSDIAGVLNMTQEASIAVSFISIEYGQDIEYVEAVLKRELPKLKEENPMILEAPEYLGVSNLGDSGVELIVTCTCNEKDIKKVTRYLNKGLLKIFYQNGINVPFPNITFSSLDMNGRKTIEDLLKDLGRTDEEPEIGIDEVPE